MNERYMQLRGLADTASIRTAKFDGKDHIVVPVVGLIGDAVVRPMNSDGPEFVPSDELALAPGGWNGRPVVEDHPEDGMASANTPENLEALSFGRLFNARFEEGKLKFEAWLDVAKAHEIGGKAKALVESLSESPDELVEVSIGAWVVAQRQEGVSPNGDPYKYIWRSITPDHLAMGLGGKPGACSVDMGCGAPRANVADNGVEVTKRVGEIEVGVKVNSGDVDKLKAVLRAAAGKQEKPSMSMRERVMNALGLAGWRNAQDSTSDVDLRRSLSDALRATEPGFEFVEEVFPEENMVVYSAMPEDRFIFYRRTYSLSDGSDLELNDDRQEVEPVTEWKPLEAAQEDSKANPKGAGAKCSCQNKSTEGDAPKGETMSKKLEEIIGGLVANEASPFTDENTELLQSLTEDQLISLQEKYVDGEVEDEPEDAVADDGDGESEGEAQAVAASQADGDELTDENWLKKAPKHLREMLERHLVMETEAREQLIGALAKAQEVFDAKALASKETSELEALAKMLRLDQPKVDYSNVVIGDSEDAELTVNAAPDPYAKALEELRAN